MDEFVKLHPVFAQWRAQVQRCRSYYHRLDTVIFRLRHAAPRCARLLALEGKFQQAETEIAPLIALHKNYRAYHHFTYEAALIHALAGKSQTAIEFLKKTVETGMPNYPLFTRDPHLARIRKEPAFIQFMNDLKTRWDQYQHEFK